MNIGVRELRDSLSRQLALVREGAEITVTDHGKPVARIVPIAAESGLERLLAPAVAHEIRARAMSAGESFEHVVAELLESSMSRTETPVTVMRNGIPVMRGAPGHIVTDELVAAYRDDL